MDMKMEFTLSGNQYRHPARQNCSNKYENEKKQADYKKCILIYLPVHQLAMISLNQIIIIELMKSQ
jgi:hypothetical protein